MAITQTKPPLYRDVRVLRIVGQVLFLLILLVAGREIWLNLQYNYDQQGLDASFDFLNTRAGFSINDSVLDYTPNDTYLDAFKAGLANTIFLVAIPGVILASILGLIVGVGRLSNNWLVRKLSQTYVEALRNTPVLVVIVIFYVGFVLALPAIDGGVSIPGTFFLSNRGLAVAYPDPQPGFGLWFLILVGGAVAAYFVRRSRIRLNEETGDETHPFLYAAGTFLAIALVGAFVAGGPVDINTPELGERGFGYEGGLQGSGELAGIMIPLALYTSAFIAEIIRGSIQAVSKGQKEAAEALGLRPMQQLRFVVLPQALRIALPPINSQYLNLAKNSSLAVAVGFNDFSSVVKTSMNQSGRSFQILLIALLVYLTLSLTISLIMNLINRSVAERGERRG